MKRNLLLSLTITTLVAGAAIFHRTAQGLAVQASGDNPASKDLVLTQTVPQRNLPPRKAVGDIYNAPITWAIGSQAEFDEFTVIDANGDDSGYFYKWYFDDDQYWPDGYARFYDLMGSNQADDWLITPGVRLEAGKRYYFDFHVVGGSQIPASGRHTFDVTCGTAATADAQTTVILNNVGVPRNADANIADMAAFQPEESGVYYFGFHVTSAAKSGNLYINNITVKEGEAPNVPGPVTALAIEADSEGALKTAISFTAPVLNIAGEDLPDDGIDGVRIERETRGADDKAQIADIKATKGQAVQYTDETFTAADFYTYTLTPYSTANGDGEPVSYTLYVGLDSPTAPTNVVLSKTDEGVKLNWQASSAYHGGVFNANDITYTIYNALNEAVGNVTGVTEWSHDVNLYVGNQGYLYYYVKASNNAGESDASVNSNALLAGAPYQAPLRETFAGGSATHFMEVKFLEDINGVTYDNQSKNAGASLVADDKSESGYAVQLQTYIADDVYIGLGMLTLDGTQSPRFTFKARNDDAQGGDLMARVYRADDTHVDFTLTPVAELTDDYATYKVDLTQFKSEQFIKVGIIYSAGTSDAYLLKRQHILVSDLFVGDIVGVDLGVEVTADQNLTVGETGHAVVNVVNNGDLDAATYHLNVTVGNIILADDDITEVLPSMSSRVFDYEFTVPAIVEDEAWQVTATVTVEGDEVEDNNTAEATIELNPSELLPVNDLAGVADDATQQVILTWMAPDANVEVNEGFEDYANYAIEMGDWKFHDGDEGAVGDFVGISDPRTGTPYAWMIINTNNYGTVNGEPGHFTESITHSGEQCLISVYGIKNKQYIANDDWIISPELSGEEQEISFWVEGARFEGGGAQTIQVLYSTTTDDVESFTAIDGDRSLEETWTEIKVTLPAGTKYFAIRNITDADNAMFVLLDDISFVKKNGEVIGYKVYRDGEFVAETTDLTFTDNYATAETAPARAPRKAEATTDINYQVTALYATGESKPASVTVTINNTATAVTDVHAEQTTNKPGVYSIDGRMINRTGDTQGLQPGAYIINGKKVLIK